MQPQLHMSIASVYCSVPSSTSGALQRKLCKKLSFTCCPLQLKAAGVSSARDLA